MIDLIASIFYTNTKFNLIKCFKAKFSYTVLSKSVSRTRTRLHSDVKKRRPKRPVAPKAVRLCDMARSFPSVIAMMYGWMLNRPRSWRDVVFSVSDTSTMASRVSTVRSWSSLYVPKIAIKQCTRINQQRCWRILNSLSNILKVLQLTEN